MTTAYQNNLIVGAGTLWVAREGAGVPERYLGEAADAAIQIQEERVVVQSMSGTPRTLLDVPRSISRMMNVSLYDCSMENLALFFGAETGAVTGLAVTRERLDISTKDGGPYYALPSARGRSVTDLRLHDAASGGMLYRDGEDFTADEASGRVRILASGRIPAPGRVWASYTVAAQQRIDVAGGPAVVGSMRYLEATPPLNPQSRGRNIYIPRASIKPNGDLPLVSREAVQIRLTATVLDPGDGGAVIVIDGEDA